MREPRRTSVTRGAVALALVVGLGCCLAPGLTAVAAQVQDLSVPAALDSLALDSLTLDSVALAGADSVATLIDRPLPNPATVAFEPVDLWDTGRSPTLAVVMTPLFPGWGQLYARNSWQAAAGFGAELYFWTNMLTRDRRAVRAKDFSETYPVGDPIRERYRAIADENWEQMRDFAWWSGGVLLIIALDAYVGTHLYDFDRDPVAVPDRWDDTFGPKDKGGPGLSAGPSLTVFQWRKAF